MDAPRKQQQWPRAQRACVVCALLMVGVASTPEVVYAYQANVDQQFRLSGSASLRSGTPRQAANGFQLTAHLSASSTKAPPKLAPAGAGYEMKAKLTLAPLVCASDTVFVNGFDG